MKRQNRSRSHPIRGKWKINSNGYGGQIIAAAGICLVVVPFGLYCFQGLLHSLGVENTTPSLMIKISLAVGAVIAGLFFLLLAVEFIQDRILDKYYSDHENQKLALADGQYECPHCGARNIGALDKRCPICGTDFQLQ